LMYWALRKGGVERPRAACRLVAFLCIQYVVYLSALVIFGVLLRAGVLPGDNPKGGTIIPAAVAGVVLVLILLIARIPGNFDRQVQRLGTRKRFAKFAARIATVPALVATGVRTAGDIVRDKRRGPPAVVGSVGFWTCNIGALWACFHAYGVEIQFGALVQGFFVGTAANLFPSPAGGVGTLDAGLIGSFILFGISEDEVFPVILTYRFAFYWLPIIPGLMMFLRLRGTVHRWEAERKAEGYTSKSKVKAEVT
nr:flippase-like domain-containing protein [Thermoleophilaceae bacterium]